MTNHPFLQQPLQAEQTPKKVIVAWHRHWTPAVSQAFKSMPHDDLMDVEVVRQLYQHGERRGKQKIAILSDGSGDVVGIVPLRWRMGSTGLPSWTLLTQLVMPYARFYVRPGYTDAALTALDCYLACDNVAFYDLPTGHHVLRPTTSWVVPLSCSYDALMQRTGYAKTDRRIRKRAAALTLVEDRFSDVPVALEYWQRKWSVRGHSYTASRKDELLLVFSTLADQGRLKTFALYDGSRVVSMQIAMVTAHCLYFMVTISLDDYRTAYPGIRTLLAGLQWACETGCREADLLYGTEEYKKNWAEPVVRAYRLSRGPYGSPFLAVALETVGDLMNRARWKLGVRR